jgi:uncharacterized protein (DUF2236 family)
MYVYEEIGVTQKTWPPSANEFEHLLDEVNGGQSERNSVGMFDSWP